MLAQLFVRQTHWDFVPLSDITHVSFAAEADSMRWHARGFEQRAALGLHFVEQPIRALPIEARERRAPRTREIEGQRRNEKTDCAHHSSTQRRDKCRRSQCL